MIVVGYDEFGPPSVLEAEEAPVPVPGDGEVLLRVEAIVVDPDDVRRRGGCCRNGPGELPGSPGGDVVGVVVALGAGVFDVTIGERVAGHVVEDGYADYVVVPAERRVRVPGGVDLDMATVLTTAGLTAYHCLRTVAALRAGESVLVGAAAGAVGHVAVQLARQLGAATVIATADGAEQLEFARSLGADHVVDHTDADWHDGVLAATGGRGVDVLLDTTCGELGRRAAVLCATSGRQVRCDAAYGAGAADVGVEKLLGMAASGAVRPIVHTRLPLVEAAKAHEILEARSQLGGVVLTPGAAGGRP